MAKSKIDIRTEVKENVVAQVLAAIPTAVKIDDYTYAVPMGVAEDNGNPLYGKIEIKCVNWYDTKSTPAFNLQNKVAAYEAELADRERRAAEKVTKKDK